MNPTAKKPSRHAFAPYLLVMLYLTQSAASKAAETGNICKMLRSIADNYVEQTRLMNSKNTPDNDQALRTINRKLRLYEVPHTTEMSPVNFISGLWKYQNVDLNMDGTPDQIEQDCGEGDPGVCFTTVKISSGHAYEVQTPFVRLLRYRQKYYALGFATVGKSARKRGSRMTFMYKVDTRSYSTICDK